MNRATERYIGYWHHHLLESLRAATGLEQSITTMNAMADSERPWLSGSCRAPTEWLISRRTLPSAWPAAYLLLINESDERDPSVDYEFSLTIVEQEETANEALLVQHLMEYDCALRDWSDRNEQAFGLMQKPFRVPEWPDALLEGEYLQGAFPAIIQIRVPDVSSSGLF